MQQTLTAVCERRTFSTEYHFIQLVQELYKFVKKTTQTMTGHSLLFVSTVILYAQFMLISSTKNNASKSYPKSIKQILKTL